MYIMLTGRSGGHEQFFPPRSNSCISFFFFLHNVAVFLLLTSVTALFWRKKYLPVRNCQEAAAIVGTVLWKRVCDAPSLCLPLVLSAQHFLCFSFSRVQPTDCLPSLTQLSALNQCRATSQKRRLIEHAPRHAVTPFGVVPSEKPRRVGQIQWVSWC